MWHFGQHCVAMYTLRCSICSPRIFGQKFARAPLTKHKLKQKSQKPDSAYATVNRIYGAEMIWKDGLCV